MEDIQLITYIIFAVLYLIFKVMQKKKASNQDQNQEMPQQQQRPKKPAMTFEEMLRDFTGEPYETDTVEEERAVRQPTQPPPPKKESQPEPPKYFSYENEYESEYDEKAQKTYQESIERGKKALTLDEQVGYEDIKVGKVQIIEDDADSGKAIPTHEYLEAFKTLDGAKKAFVHSEIFNRKYT